MKKNFSTRIFNLLCKRVYKLSKKRKLGWTWNDCQRWTSANLFKQYKGKPISKIKVTEVDNNIISVLDGVPSAMPIPSAPEICSSVKLIADVDLQPIEAWWDIDDDKFTTFDDFLNFRVLIKGVDDIGIFKKKDLDAISIREKLRIFYKNSSDSPIFVFKRMYKFGKTGSANPCDTYLLFTDELSDFDDKDEIKAKVKVSELPKETQQKRAEEKLKAKKKKPKKTKADVKRIELPKQVEVKTKGVVKLEAERHEALTKALEILRKDFDDGILTKKEYKERQNIILKKFEDGGLT
jgi:hypothetical protein